MLFQNAEEVLNALVRAYYTDRDLDAILACVTDDVTWVGTENDDSAHGKVAFRALMEKDIAAFPDSLGVVSDPPLVEPLGDSAALLTVTGRQIAVPGVAAGFELRSTVCCVKTEQGWRIRSLHASVPNSEVERLALQHELSATLEKQAALLHSVPGGVAMRDKLHEQQRNRDLYDLLGIAYWEWSRVGGYYHSEKYEEYAVSEIKPELIWDAEISYQYIHPEDVDLMKAFMQPHPEDEIKKSAIVRCKMRDGSYHWTEMFSMVEEAPDGKLERLVTIMRDVDKTWLDQKEQLEAALAEAKSASKWKVHFCCG